MIARLLVAVLAVAALGAGESTRLTVTGSSTVAPLVTEIAKRFEARHPGVRIDVQTGGSSRGLADAESGVADIGMVSRALKPDEPVLAHTIARDGVCLIVHRSNPVVALSDQQVVAIYTGQVAGWKEVGGPDLPIVVVNKAEGRSTLEVFCGHFKLKNADIKAAVVIGDNEQGVKTVAGNPAAIGYVSIGTAESDAAVGVAIRLLPMGGIAPSVGNVRSGTFPLSRPLNLVTKGVPTGLAARFIAFATSDEVFDLVRDLNLVPIR